MNINFRDKQAEKFKATALSTKSNHPKSDQSEISYMVKKNRKKRWQKKKREKREASTKNNTLAIKPNAVASRKKKSGQNLALNQEQNRGQQDLS